MGRLNSESGPAFEKSTEALVLEAPNHGISVLRNVTGVNRRCSRQTTGIAGENGQLPVVVNEEKPNEILNFDELRLKRFRL